MIQAKPPAVILAGGRATRMGGSDKVLLVLNGQTLLTRVLDRLAPQADPVALNANGPPARFASYGLRVLADSVPDHPGPLAGILAAMDWAAGLGAGHVLTVAGDTPFFPHDLAARRVAQAGAAPVLAATDRLHPTFGLWPTALRDTLRAALAQGTRKVALWAQDQGAVRVVFPAVPQDPLFNINTPADLARAEGLS